jgi:hypothetical protein
MVEHDQHSRRAIGAGTRKDVAQRRIRKRGRGRDHSLVRFKWHAIEESALLETNGHVALFRLPEKYSQRAVLRAIRRHRNRTQPLAGE